MTVSAPCEQFARTAGMAGARYKSPIDPAFPRDTRAILQSLNDMKSVIRALWTVVTPSGTSRGLGT